MNTIKMRRLCALIITANVGTLSLGSQSLPLLAQPRPNAQPARPATGTAAEVNGEKISNADVERILARIRAAQPPLQANTPEARKALQEIRGAVVEERIDFRLRVQEARKQQIAPTPAQVDQSVAEFRKKFNLTTDAQAKAFLAEQGKSLGDLRLLVTEALMVNALESKWAAPVAITESEIAEAYRANITRYTLPELVRARHILIAFGKEKPSEAEKATALKKAQDVLRQAKATGADFGTLAKANSDDPGSKNIGGVLDLFPRGIMIEPFEKAAFAAKAGELVGPVETTFGYHLIKVEEKLAARTLPLQDPKVREDLRGPLLERKREIALAAQMEALRQNAKIKKSS